MSHLSGLLYLCFACQDLKGFAHKLPLCRSIKQLEFAEVKAIVHLVSNIDKSVGTVAVKRKHDITSGE